MRNIAIDKLIERNVDFRQSALHDVSNYNMNRIGFYAFCHYLYLYMQNDGHQNEMFKLFEQASVYMDNSILSKYKQTKNSRKSRQVELFEKFISIIKQYCSQEHSVRFYAEKLFITSQYLSKVTKDVSGRTANDWIDEFVLQEAKTLLLYTNLSIQEIGFNIGFADQSSFGKFFKKNVGLSPRHFAQKYAR